MKRSITGGILAVALLISMTAAGADVGSLPGGTSISVDITTPAAGGFGEAAGVTLSGEASIGMGAAVKDTSVVYILDVSGSTNGSANVDCDGDEVDDSILDCEKEAVSVVNADASSMNSPVLNSGLGVFQSFGTVIQGLTAPGLAIETALGAVPPPGGGTSFGAGLSAANSILTTGPAAANKIVVFLTDGAGTGSSPLPAGTVVKAFAFGAATCSGNLVAISDTCAVVEDLSDLGDVINESIGATLDSLSYSIDGGAAIPLTSSPATPIAGPADVTFEENVGTLAMGPHQICVEATGTDSGGSSSTADCVEFEVVQSMVDCSDPETECVATANDGDVSQATVVGTPSFTKMLGILPVPTDPGECAGDDCVTGYDVLFAGAGNEGVVELTVVASKENSTPPGQAAVYIDGIEVTAKCHKTASKSPIPCANITKSKGGQTQYFVRFNADPGFRFK